MTRQNGMKDLFGDTPFGTEPRKLYRPGDPATSKAAAEEVDTTMLERMVYNTIVSFGANGCISDQVRAAHPHKAYSSITARYKALKEKNLIVHGPDTRIGKTRRPQGVMRAVCAIPK